MKTYKDIPTMSPPVVQDYLYQLGKQWKGHGIAVELGSWLGATAVPLLTGLKEAGYNLPFICYDRWRANEKEVDRAKSYGLNVHSGDDLLPLFKRNVKPVYGNVQCRQGMITDTIPKYRDRRIEFCIFDAPKQRHVFNVSVKSLLPYWIPKITIVGLLDYYMYEKRTGKARDRLMAPVEFIENNKDCFTKLAEWRGQTSAVFFRYEKEINY
jgi:hypothetical protein